MSEKQGIRRMSLDIENGGVERSSLRRSFNDGVRTVQAVVEGLTPGQMYLNIVKAYLGTGLVAIPNALCNAGFFAGLGSMLLLAFLLNHTMKLGVRMKVAVEKEEKEKRRKQELQGHNVRCSQELHDVDIVAYPVPVDEANREVNEFNRHEFTRIKKGNNHGIGNRGIRIIQEGIITNRDGEEPRLVEEEARLLLQRDSEQEGDQEEIEGMNFTAFFPEIGEYCFGKLGRILINLAALGTNIGISIGYLCGIAKMLGNVIGQQNLEKYHLEIKIQIGNTIFPFKLLFIILFPFFWALNCVRTKYLGFTSILGNIAVFATLLVVIIYSCDFIMSGMDPNTIDSKELEFFIKANKPIPNWKNNWSDVNNEQIRGIIGSHDHENLNSNKSAIGDTFQPTIIINPWIETFDTKNWKKYHWWVNSKYAESFGVFMFSFVMHGTILGQYQELNKADKNVPKACCILNGAAALVIFLYTAYGASAYLAYNPQNKDNILETLDVSLNPASNAALYAAQPYIISIVNVLLSVAIFCSIPLFMQSVYTVWGLDYAEGPIHQGREHHQTSMQGQDGRSDETQHRDNSAVYRGERGDFQSGSIAQGIPISQQQNGNRVHQVVPEIVNNNNIEEDNVRQKSVLEVIIWRGLICLILMVIAQLLGNNFGNILQLVGSLTMSPLGCILPAVFYLKFASINKARQKEKARIEQARNDMQLLAGNSHGVVYGGLQGRLASGGGGLQEASASTSTINPNAEPLTQSDRIQEDPCKIPIHYNEQLEGFQLKSLDCGLTLLTGILGTIGMVLGVFFALKNMITG